VHPFVRSFSPRTAPLFGAGPPPRRYRPKQQCSMLPRTEGALRPVPGIQVFPDVRLFPSVRLFQTFRTFGCSGCSDRSGRFCRQVFPVTPVGPSVSSSPVPGRNPCPSPANPPPDRFDSRPPAPNFSSRQSRRPRRAERRKRKYPAAEAPGISFVCDRGRFLDRTRRPGRIFSSTLPACSVTDRTSRSDCRPAAARKARNASSARLLRRLPRARTIRIRRYAFEPS
jgi:hypothetical protein